MIVRELLMCWNTLLFLVLSSLARIEVNPFPLIASSSIYYPCSFCCLSSKFSILLWGCSNLGYPFSKCLSTKLKNPPTINCVVWFCLRNRNLTSPWPVYRLLAGTGKNVPLVLAILCASHDSARQPHGWWGKSDYAWLLWNRLLFLFGGVREQKRSFRVYLHSFLLSFFPFLIPPPVVAHNAKPPQQFQKDSLTLWKLSLHNEDRVRIKERGTALFFCTQLSERDGLFGFESEQNDWFLSSTEDWRIKPLSPEATSLCRWKLRIFTIVRNLFKNT